MMLYIEAVPIIAHSSVHTAISFNNSLCILPLKYLTRFQIVPLHLGRILVEKNGWWGVQKYSVLRSMEALMFTSNIWRLPVILLSISDPFHWCLLSRMRLLRTQSEQSVYIPSVTNKKKYNSIEQNEKKNCANTNANANTRAHIKKDNGK